MCLLRICYGMLRLVIYNSHADALFILFQCWWKEQDRVKVTYRFHKILSVSIQMYLCHSEGRYSIGYPSKIYLKFKSRENPFIHMSRCSCPNKLKFSLRWRHSGSNSVSNHQPYHCLLNRLFKRRSKKTSKLRVTGLCVGNSPGPVNSPHKWPVTRKMSPFDDVIM